MKASSNRRASESEIRVSGRRHSGEAIRPCRHSRYLIGMGWASANNSGTKAASGAQAARAGEVVDGEPPADLDEALGQDMACRQDAAVGAAGHHGEVERVLAGQ